VLGTEAIPIMEPLLARVHGWMARTSHEESARAAVYGLGQLRHGASVRVLEQASTSRCRSVRAEARKMLERLKGVAE